VSGSQAWDCSSSRILDSRRSYVTNAVGSSPCHTGPKHQTRVRTQGKQVLCFNDAATCVIIIITTNNIIICLLYENLIFEALVRHERRRLVALPHGLHNTRLR
jgi:hypothetical protein